MAPSSPGASSPPTLLCRITPSGSLTARLLCSVTFLEHMVLNNSIYFSCVLLRLSFFFFLFPCPFFSSLLFSGKEGARRRGWGSSEPRDPALHPLALCPPNYRREAAHRAGEPLGVSRGRGRTGKGIIRHGAEGPLGCVGAEQHQGCRGAWGAGPRLLQAVPSLLNRAQPSLGASCAMTHWSTGCLVFTALHGVARSSRALGDVWVPHAGPAGVLGAFLGYGYGSGVPWVPAVCINHLLSLPSPG